tara:strand:- start:1990 stop:2934 length:945 start_codon:yes stop_codon:yes gene_type:complete
MRKNIVTTLVEKRKHVYKNLAGYEKQSFPGLVYFYDSDLRDLSSSISAYLENSLEAFYGKKFSIKTDEDLENHTLEILQLPNVTPNGAILPKNETASFLNNAQTEVIKILDNHNISEHIEKLMCIHVMIKAPCQSVDTQNRPYYTGKIHSDAWVGHHGDAIFMAGVLGDIEGSTVEYFEPIRPNSDFLTISSNFNEAHKRYFDKRYIGKMENSKLIAMDHACLHRTKFELNSRTRISINFGVLMKSTFSHENSVEVIERFGESYFTIDKLRRVGKDLTLFVDETFYQCEQKFKNGDIEVQSLPNNGIVLKEKYV